MPVPGYDPDDLEKMLQKRLRGETPTELLTDEELRAYESGERLLEALDSDTIEALLGLEN